MPLWRRSAGWQSVARGLKMLSLVAKDAKERESKAVFMDNAGLGNGNGAIRGGKGKED